MPVAFRSEGAREQAWDRSHPPHLNSCPLSVSFAANTRPGPGPAQGPRRLGAMPSLRFHGDKGDEGVRPGLPQRIFHANHTIVKVFLFVKSSSRTQAFRSGRSLSLSRREPCGPSRRAAAWGPPPGSLGAHPGVLPLPSLPTELPTGRGPLGLSLAGPGRALWVVLRPPFGEPRVLRW